MTIDQVRAQMQTGFPWHEPDIPHSQLLQGLPWWEYIQGLLAAGLVRIGLDSRLAQTAASQVREEYLDATCWHLYDDALEALAGVMEAGHRNCILSNHVPELQQLAHGLGLAPHVESVFTSGLIGFEKPNPRIFQIARAALGGPPQCCMVGDSYAMDILGANASGMLGILVRKPNATGYPHYSADLRGAVRILRDPRLCWDQPPSVSGPALDPDAVPESRNAPGAD